MKEKAVWETGNINEFENVVSELFGILKNLNGNNVVVGLVGNLGAGKTTLSKIIAKQLSVKDDVVSPTFNIMKVYETGDNKFKKFIHIDAYRIDTQEEVLSLTQNLKIDNYFKMDNSLVFIEWPENIKSILPQNTTYVEILHDSENTEKRHISLL